MEAEQGKRAGLVVCARREGDVLTVTARGALSYRGLVNARAYVLGEFRRLDGRAVVADFSAVLYPVGDDSLMEAFAHPSGTIPAPVAFVIPQNAYDLMRGVAWKLAELGHVRGVFLARADALAWAADRREYWTHRPGLVLPASAAG
jgi:hypothetical protein